MAVIVCGTNSTRLLVVDASGVPLARELRVTRLGRGVDATGQIATETIAATVEVLREYRRTIEALGVDRVRLAATSAARDAANRKVFLVAAEEAVGVPLEVLSGGDEARLAFRGATAGLHPLRGSVLVVDIGGGSTEFAVGSAEDPPAEPEGVTSLDIGCLRLTERWLTGDPPGARQLSQALSVVRDELDRVSRALPTVTEATGIVLVGGTITRLPAVTQRLIRFQDERAHHSVLPLASVEDLLETLAVQSRRDRVHSPGLETDLADVMLGGAAILAMVMRYFDFEECVVSEGDLLDGLVLSVPDKTSTTRRSGRARRGS